MEKRYQLPNMEYQFDLQVTGEESNINWVGKFTYKRPTLAERSSINVMAAKLNGGLIMLDQDVRAFNEAIAHLRYTIKDFPQWWQDSGYGADLYDGNVVMEIYNKCIAFEAKWREKVHGGKAEAVEVGNEIRESVGDAKESNA